MNDEIINELLKAIKGLNLRIDEAESDYCNAKQAQAIISLPKHEQLKFLVDKGLLAKYPRGNGFRFKKSDCRKIAELIDRSEVKLPSY